MQQVEMISHLSHTPLGGNQSCKEYKTMKLKKQVKIKVSSTQIPKMQQEQPLVQTKKQQDVNINHCKECTGL